MKKLAIACICAATSIANAETNTCLNNLQGKFFHQERRTQSHVLTIQYNKDLWQFKRPDGSKANKEGLFQDSFDKAATLQARPIPDEHVAGFGSAVLTQYLDKPGEIQGVRFECGLITDDFYVIKIDLSEANPQLIKNMVMMKKAMEKDEHYDSQPTAKEIEEMRKQKYFSGQPFKLEGVTSGIVGFMLNKR
jgi:hypothetical protein